MAEQSEQQKNRERKEREFIVSMIISDKKKLDRLNNIFKTMGGNIEREINAYFGKYAEGEDGTVTNWQNKADKSEIERLKRLLDEMLKEEDNERTLTGDELTENAVNEVKATPMSARPNRLVLLQVFIGLEIIKAMSNYEKLVADVLESAVVEQFTRQTNLDMLPSKWKRSVGKSFTAKDINDIVNNNVVNMTWSENIWGIQQAELRSDVERLVRRGVVNGVNPKKLARDITEKYDVTRMQAERLMRTEERRAQTQAQMESYAKQGFTKYLYIAEPDACKICLHLDDGVPKDIVRGSINVNLPPMHPNCRCSTTPYMEL